jgi:hypothetical protein
MRIRKGIHPSTLGEYLPILTASVQHYEQGYGVRRSQTRWDVKVVIAGLPGECILQNGVMGRSEFTAYPTDPPQRSRVPG